MRIRFLFLACTSQDLMAHDKAVDNSTGFVMPSCMQIGEPALAEHVSQTAGPLKGPHVLQIVQCIDVGHPSKDGVSGSSAKRC